MEELITVEGQPHYLDKEKWDGLLDAYYAFHNWNLETGWPTRKTLEALDLGEIAERLEQEGRLPK